MTSTNAEHIIHQIPADRPILFSPDKHLGGYLKRKTGRENMVLWQSVCIVHDQFSERELIKLQTQHPEAHTIAHPECPEALLARADHVGSTSSLLRFTAERPGKSFIVLTEPGILHQMRKRSPGSIFYDVPGMDGECACNNCPFMKLNTLEKLYLCMMNERPEIVLEDDLRKRAHASLSNMLEMSEGVGGPVLTTV